MPLTRLRRSTDDRVVLGVCGGIAEAIDVDPTLVRLVFALLALAGGAGVVLYFAAHLAISGITRLRCDYPSKPVRLALTQSILLGWLIVFLPYCILQGFSRLAGEQCLVALVAITTATLIFNATQPGMENCPTDSPRWFRQGGIVLIVSAVAAVMNHGL